MLINEKIKIFIISGKSSAGKDITAKVISNYAKNKNLKTINIQISKYIKMYAELISNWNGSDNNKPRTLLQNLGNDIRDNYDKYFFINRIIDDIKICSSYCDIITISDARLPYEIETITNCFPNSYKIHIIRPNYQSKLTPLEQRHVTETALDNYQNFDYCIINDKKLANLKDEVKNIISQII